MTVFSGRQVVPVDHESESSQRLLEACLSGDLKSALDCIADPSVDINFVGTVFFKSKKTEFLLRDKSPSEVRIEYEEFNTDVTALFLAVHTGNVFLVKKLLSSGADVNQKVFKGFATTAAVREGQLEVLEILLKAGASQPACEEALFEASCCGHPRLADLLMGSDLIRLHIAVHALVTASCRGFVDVVEILMKRGVEASAVDRVLLQSTKPALHANVNCSALVAAVVNRQVDVVRLLLQGGARTDLKVRLGAWSWDMTSGEEFRVGAGLGEPYPITWCAVEFFETSGTILHLLLQRLPSNDQHYGRTLLHHAILCSNTMAVRLLLEHGADVECPVKTTKNEFRPIHMASRLGLSAIIQCLIEFGCSLNSRTDVGDTALMISAKYKHEKCLKELAMAGSDFGLLNAAGQSASSIAVSNRWGLGFQQTILDVIKAGMMLKSSNNSVFYSLLFVASTGDIEALESIICQGGFNLDHQDDKGFSAVMLTALKGHVEAFRVLVYAGADVKLCSKSGENVLTLSAFNENRDLFEKVMLEFALERGNHDAGGFNALHCASRRGDFDAVQLLTNKGYDVNVADGAGYTPLMLAAREGHGAICKLLISKGARCNTRSPKGETALSLARNCVGGVNDAANVILDEFARHLVLGGAKIQKHTKGGKGSTHMKELRMESTGVLRWGNSSRRNVVCREAEVGPSKAFSKNRTKKGDANDPGVFRVMTAKNKEVHFVCGGGMEVAALWVRGIKLVTREAIFGQQSQSVLNPVCTN